MKLDVAALRATHNPQPSRGKVLSGLHVARDGAWFRLWDEHYTTGYLCSTQDPNALAELLRMEAEAPGAVRALITGEITFWEVTPPHPGQDTYRAAVTLDELLS